MLLSWLDRLTLFVHPHRLVLERQPWRGAATRQQASVGATADGQPDWQAALTAAQTLLKASGRGGARLTIIIADHFVRYALLPWSDALSSPKSRQLMARALLRNSLGDKANALEIAVDRPLFGRNGLAAGVDRELLAGLRAAARAPRLRLSSMQPRLIAELANHRQALGDGWFAAIDREWLTLAGVRGGQLVCLHNHRADTGDTAPGGGQLSSQLAGLLAAESATVEARKLFICSRELSPGVRIAVPTLGPDWQTTQWPALLGGALHA